MTIIIRLADIHVRSTGCAVKPMTDNTLTETG